MSCENGWAIEGMSGMSQIDRRNEASAEREIV